MIRATSSKITLGLKSGHSWRATPGPLVLKSLTTPGGGDPLHLAHGTGLVVCCCCFVHIDRLRVPHETFRRRTQGQVRALPGRVIDGDEPRHGRDGRGRAGAGPEGVEGLGALRSPSPHPLPNIRSVHFDCCWGGREKHYTLGTGRMGEVVFEKGRTAYSLRVLCALIRDASLAGWRDAATAWRPGRRGDASAASTHRSDPRSPKSGI